VGVPDGVGVGVEVPGSPFCTSTHCENSDVLSGWTRWQRRTSRPNRLASVSVNAIIPSLSLSKTVLSPTNTWPSPYPDGSQASFTRKNRLKYRPGVLFSEPVSFSPPDSATAEVRTG
jgi:hypothetical protein